MRVFKIEEGLKTFQTRGGQKTRHDIYFTDGEKQYRGEFLTTTPEQRSFTLDEMCCFEVTDSKMHEILKCGAEAVGTSYPTQYQPSHYANSTPMADDDFSPNVSGKSHCFALAYAKDIAVARIRMGHITGEEENFMNDILKDAWQMHQWMLDPTPPKEPLPF